MRKQDSSCSWEPARSKSKQVNASDDLWSFVEERQSPSLVYITYSARLPCKNTDAGIYPVGSEITDWTLVDLAGRNINGPPIVWNLDLISGKLIILHKCAAGGVRVNLCVRTSAPVMVMWKWLRLMRAPDCTRHKNNKEMLFALTECFDSLCSSKSPKGSVHPSDKKAFSLTYLKQIVLVLFTKVSASTAAQWDKWNLPCVGHSIEKVPLKNSITKHTELWLDSTNGIFEWYFTYFFVQIFIALHQSLLLHCTFFNNRSTVTFFPFHCYLVHLCIILFECHSKEP